MVQLTLLVLFSLITNWVNAQDGVKGGYSPSASYTKPIFEGTSPFESNLPYIAPPPAPAPEPPGSGPDLDALYGPPVPYSFGYETNGDGRTSRHETSDGRRVTGSYTLVGADGINRVVHYVADGDGFRASIITNEPGTEKQNPSGVIMESSQPKAEILSRQHVPVTSERFPKYTGAAAQQVVSKLNQKSIEKPLHQTPVQRYAQQQQRYEQVQQQQRFEEVQQQPQPQRFEQAQHQPQQFEQAQQPQRFEQAQQQPQRFEQAQHKPEPTKPVRFQKVSLPQSYSVKGSINQQQHQVARYQPPVPQPPPRPAVLHPVKSAQQPSEKYKYEPIQAQKQLSHVAFKPQVNQISKTSASVKPSPLRTKSLPAPSYTPSKTRLASNAIKRPAQSFPTQKFQVPQAPTKTHSKVNSQRVLRPFYLRPAIPSTALPPPPPPSPPAKIEQQKVERYEEQPLQLKEPLEQQNDEQQSFQKTYF